MIFRFWICALALLVLPSARIALAATPTPGEMATASRWVETTLLAADSRKPFSFVYGAKDSQSLLKTWPHVTAVRQLDANRRQHRLAWTDPATHLEVRCVATEYADFPAVEWVLWFKNTGQADTPILESILPLDGIFTAGEQPGPFTLYYARGSHQRSDDFQPLETSLFVTGEQVVLDSFGGRSSDSYLPFFNLAKPKEDGIIISVGWTGQWSAVFRRGGPANILAQSGMEATHLKLATGEEIRSPSSLLVFWSGPGRMRGQNLLRALLREHYSPAPGGRRVVPPIALSPHAEFSFERCNAKAMLDGIEIIAGKKLPIDTWWIDTGWFNLVDKNWATSVGNPDPDAIRYPEGLRPIGEAAHRHNLKFLLWFEPERVMPETWLWRNHRSWLLEPPPNLPFELRYMRKSGFHLLDLGNPAALAWLKQKIGGMIGEAGIDVYRHDFNMYPLEYWRWNEPADRQGMREIKFVMGLYDFWDDLLRRYPNLLIDNCASGGRRIDHEMLRRSLPLWRSDMAWDDIDAVQSMQHALSLWLPITGMGSNSVDPYNFRSGMGAHFDLVLKYLADPNSLDAARPLLEQYAAIRHLYQAEYYPLTPYSLQRGVWMAWQFDQPATGEGLVQAFRREDSSVASSTYRLSALSPGATYEIRNLDEPAPLRATGKQLMETGLTIHLAKPRSAAVLTYRRQ
jgi:alpha-galactosidase